MNFTPKTIIISVVSVVVIIVGLFAAFAKPYNAPEFVDILPNETAFLVPLEGQTSDQAAFESEKYLQDSQVATKRIQIPKRWVQTGRMWYKGEYKPTMAVIKVDRTQETREWTAESGEGVKVRSKDGIGFTVGVSATSGIENSAKFMYQTRGNKTLAQVMDSEIRNLFETKLIEEFAKNDMTFINTNKGLIMETVSKTIIDSFKETRGISISNMGYKGDIVFDDPKVQEAMNAKFKALQEQDAQTTRNKTALNNSLNEIEVEKNNAKATVEKAKGISESNREVQKSLTDGVLHQQWIEAWKAGGSQVPQTVVGEAGNSFIQVPAAAVIAKEKK